MDLKKAKKKHKIKKTIIKVVNKLLVMMICSLMNNKYLIIQNNQPIKL